jgi:hypothetical protein
VPVPVFCYFCVSKKLHRKYSHNWTKQKPKFLFFPTRDRVQSRDEGELGAIHTIGWRSLAPGRAISWWGHLAYLLAPPFRLYILLSEKTLGPPSSMQDWEGPEALPGTVPERGITTIGLLHHHASLRSDV